jgi:tetratricopeptide (TPR) repeat protein
VVAGLVIAGTAFAVWRLVPESPEQLRDRAEAAAHAHNWPAARKLWRAVNQTKLASSRTIMAEARANLGLDRAAEAERAWRRAIVADPADPEPWRAELQLFWVEDRPVDAMRVGWEAYEAVPPESRREILRGLTLALLADLPDDRARGYLNQWIAADPTDGDARVALLQRVAAQPLSGDPDRAERIAILTELLEKTPTLNSAREALALALADDAQPERGRQLIESWPAETRDARYWRLLGRWQLDYEHRPAEAVASFEHALAELPHDWRTHYKLARALKALGRTEDANRSAETVRRLREVLDLTTLGPRLKADLDRLDDPAALRDLASLCARAGLTRLADAWRQESRIGPTSAISGP